MIFHDKLKIIVFCVVAFRFVPVHAQEASTKYAVVGVGDDDTLKVRSKPDGQSTPVAKLANGTTGIQIQGKVLMNGPTDWVHITFPGGEGWTRPKYLAAMRPEIGEDTASQPAAVVDDRPKFRAAILRGDVETAGLYATPVLVNEIFNDTTPYMQAINQNNAAMVQMLAHHGLNLDMHIVNRDYSPDRLSLACYAAAEGKLEAAQAFAAVGAGTEEDVKRGKEICVRIANTSRPSSTRHSINDDILGWLDKTTRTPSIFQHD